MSSRQNTLHGLSTKSELIVSWGGPYRFTVFHGYVAIWCNLDDKWIPKWIQFSTVLGRHHIPNQGGTSWLVTGEFERCRIISPMYHLHRTWDTWSSEGSGLSKILRSFKRLAAGVSGPQSLMLIWYMDFGPVPFRNRFCEYLIIVWLSFRLSFFWASISGNIAKYWKTATKKYRVPRAFWLQATMRTVHRWDRPRRTGLCPKGNVRDLVAVDPKGNIILYICIFLRNIYRVIFKETYSCAKL